MLPKVAIIELGSQTTLLIEKALREKGVRSVVLDRHKATAWLAVNQVLAVILSGGVASVYEEDAPQPPETVLSLKRQDGRPVPVLGICYGMQWLAQRLGGAVQAVKGGRQYGKADIQVTLAGLNGSMFDGTPKDQHVWMNHGDSVIRIPDGFRAVAYSGLNTLAAMQNDSMWGVQFHPEVTHTEHGKAILANFLRFAGCEEDWQPSSIVESIQTRIVDEIGEARAIIGFSGGVDSTTLARIAAPVLGNTLLAVTIDGGHLREGELDEIRAHAKAAGVKLRVVDAHKEFQEVLTYRTFKGDSFYWPKKAFAVLRNFLLSAIGMEPGCIDAEKKRFYFKKVYRWCLMQQALLWANLFGTDVEVAVLQGTLGPDRIESGKTGGALIKSHHNIGLDFRPFRQLHPIDNLFKYEVRALAQEIGLPESVWNRQPFPGPGLFPRVVGVPATPDKLELVRWADARTKEVLVKHGYYEELSQLVVAYIGTKTVGVKGEGRVYGGAIVVRGVKTIDFMTVEGVWFPKHVVAELKQVLTSHPEVVRVWFDPTDKPCATTEME